MKKLSTLEIVVIPVLVALTIIVKLPFSKIPNIEVATPLFIALVLLLKRHLGLYYLVLFLIVDSLLTQQGNFAYIVNNGIMWTVIFGIVLLLKNIKQFRPVTIFVVGFVAVLWQTFISFWLLSLIAPIPGFGFSLGAMKIAWIFDITSGHPTVTGALAVTIYFALLEVIKTVQIKGVFDKA